MIYKYVQRPLKGLLITTMSLTLINTTACGQTAKSTPSANTGTTPEVTEAVTIETGASDWNPDGLMEEKRDEYAETAYTDMKEADRQQAEAYLAEKGVQVPADLEPIFERVAGEEGFSPEFLEAVSWNESRYNRLAQNGPCKGLMQTNVNYWHQKNWQDPEQNIRAACKCMTAIIDQYGSEDLGSIAFHYHGEQGSERYSNYPAEVAQVAEALERVHGK